MAAGSARVGTNPVRQLPKRLAPVTDGRLARPLDLAERAAIGGIVKDGVVAEAMFAARFGCDQTLDDAGCFETDMSAVCDGNMGHEAGGTRIQTLILQPAVDHRKLGRIVVAVPAGRMDPGLAAKRVDDQT